MKKSLTKIFMLALLSALVFSSCATDSGNSDDKGSPSVPEDKPGDKGTPLPEEKPEEKIDEPALSVDVSNSTVKIVKGEGWLNSAYIIFEQIDGASYKVLCDDKEVDSPLIRYYDEYIYYEPSEKDGLEVSWKKQSLSKVVRADALGLEAGEHTLKVAALSGDSSTEYSSAKVTVLDHDRSGFAFTGPDTPGAYRKNGTLKDGAVVIYLTQENKNTVKATLGGKEYTGIKDITQAIKKKNLKNPVDIRVIGTVRAENNDLSCADLKSAYALGVKEAAQVTIEGVGHDAVLFAAGVAAFKSDYIEVSNLGLIKWGGGHDGDGVALKEDSYAWIHNCDFFYGNAGGDADQAKGDGSMDLKDNSNHVTISYNHFWDSGKMSLCGMKSESGPNYISYHHNWFDHSDSRHPRVRTMSVHVYNNYFDGNSKYGVGVTYGASCFVEGNFFRNAHDPMMSSMQGTDARGSGTFSSEKGGVIKAYNNKFVQNNTNGVKFQYVTNKYDYTYNKEMGADADLTDIDAWEVDSRSEKVPDSVTAKNGGSKYSNFDTELGNSGLGLSEDPADPEKAKADVLKFSGRHLSDYAWTFTNSKDDASYALNSALNSELNEYKTRLTKIQKNAASSAEEKGQGEESEKTETEGNLPPATGAAIVALVSDGKVVSSDSRVKLESCAINASEKNGALTVTYQGNSYATVKMESSSKITVKAAEGVSITVIGSLPAGKQSCFKLNGKAVKLDSKTTAVTPFEKSFVSTGNDVISKGDTAAIGVIAISE